MSPSIAHVSSALLLRLGDAAARSLLLGCLAALLLGLARVRSVSVKLLVWRGVLFAALAMPILVGVLPIVPIHVLLPGLGQQSAAAVTEPAFIRTTVVPAVDAAQTDAVNTSAPYHSTLPNAEFAPPPHQPQIAWPVFFAAAYVSFACFVLARVALGMRLAKRLEQASTPVWDERALSAVADRSRIEGLKLDPRILESEVASAPVTLGVRHPAIVLPADWRSWEPGELDAVLAHEVSHVARRDALAQRLSLIHRAIFWFSPLAWWLDRRLADLAEQASDEAALASGVDRKRYAETLLGFFAALEGAPERIWWHGVSMAKPGQAEKRVERILGWRGVMSSKLSKSIVLAFAAVAVPVIGLTAAVHQVDMYTYDDQEPASPPSPVAPAPAAKGVIYPGPAPQMPAAPQALPEPATAPEPALAPSQPITPIAPAITPIPPVAEGSQAGESIDEAREAVQRAKEAVKRAQGDLRAAQAQIVGQVSDDRERAYKASMEAYQRAMRQLDSQRQQYHALVAQAMERAKEAEARYRIVGTYYDSGPRFVIVTKGQEGVTMSGSEEDAEHARSLRTKIPGDFIWFERDEKSYIIRDRATVDRAKKLWEPEEELGKKQELLGKQQEALGKQQEELGRKMEEVRVKIPDMTAEMQALMAKMKELSTNGGTQSEIGELQSQIGELQSRVGEIQSEAGHQQSQVGREQGELGRRQGELGRQQGELGRQQGELARRASGEMKQLLDDAIARGVAQPE